jgi:hypothetical protein
MSVRFMQILVFAAQRSTWDRGLYLLLTAWNQEMEGYTLVSSLPPREHYVYIFYSRQIDSVMERFCEHLTGVSMKIGLNTDPDLIISVLTCLYFSHKYCYMHHIVPIDPKACLLSVLWSNKCEHLIQYVILLSMLQCVPFHPSSPIVTASYEIKVSSIVPIFWTQYEWYIPTI